MPASKKPQTFDQHLGAVVGGLAKPHGGRPFLVSLLDWSKGTVDRRIAGTAPFLVREIEVVARALNTTPASLAEQALKNYSGGSEQDGIDKLLAEEGLEPVSEPPASLDDQRQKKTVPPGKRPSEMTEEELDAFEGESAANTDPELGYDEPEAP